MPIVLDARTANDHFPGIGRYVINLARALPQIAPDLDLVLLRDPAVISMHLTLPTLPHIACSVSPFSIRQQWDVPWLVRQAQATLYHSPYYLMPYWSGIPSVFTCHDLIPLIWTQYYTAAQRLIYWLTHTLALRTAQTTIAVSHSTQADLIRHFRVDPKRIIVIHEAAGEHFAPQPPEVIQAAQVKYALPDQYVLYFASNKPHKNLARLVRAWSVVRTYTPVSNVKLLVAGYWDNRYSEAKQIVEESELQDQVIFIGPVDDADLPALYSGAMVFVFPSLYEGFGLPVLEAMACGTPVICSNTASLPELAGKAAIQIAPTDTKSLAQAIAQTLASHELRQHLRQKGLEQAAKFSWQRAAQETLKVYQALGVR